MGRLIIHCPCRSKNHFRHYGLNRFMTLPLCAAMGCVLNSLRSSNVSHNAQTQTFQRLSKLTKEVSLSPAPRLKTSRQIKKRSRNPEIAPPLGDDPFAAKP